MSENNDNIKVFQLESLYQAINPNITTNRSGVVWFNSSDEEEDNAFPARLLDLYINKSSTHANFIALKSNLTYASGLLPKDKLDVGTQEFLNQKNRAGQNFNEIYQRLAQDFSVFESAALQVLYNSTGQIAEVYHVDVSNLRAEEPDEFGNICNWYYNPNWGYIVNKRTAKVQNSMRNAVKIASFNPDKWEESEGRQILYLKKYVAGQDIYPIPAYFSAINYIDLDYELSKFHLNKVSNGMFPSAMISMKGNPDEQEKDLFIQKFKQKHSGSGNAGKIVFMWGDETQTPVITRLEMDSNNSLFETLNNIASQKIATGHQADLSLAGIEGRGSDLGGTANRINLARLNFVDTCIKTYQQILVNGINKILSVNGLGEVTVINEGLKIEQPVQQPTDLTTNERRSILFGLPPITTSETSVPIVEEEPSAGQAPTTSESVQPEMNPALASMTGRMWQNLNRILRLINQSKLSKEAGIAMIKASFGLDDSTILSLLGEGEEEEIIEEEYKVKK
jgi:hypothetical protein